MNNCLKIEMDEYLSDQTKQQQANENQLFFLAHLYPQQQLATKQKETQSSGFLCTSGGGVGIDCHCKPQHQQLESSSSGSASWSSQTGSKLIINYLPKEITQEKVIKSIIFWHIFSGGVVYYICMHKCSPGG